LTALGISLFLPSPVGRVDCRIRRPTSRCSHRRPSAIRRLPLSSPLSLWSATWLCSLATFFPALSSFCLDCHCRALLLSRRGWGNSSVCPSGRVPRISDPLKTLSRDLVPDGVGLYLAVFECSNGVPFAHIPGWSGCHSLISQPQPLSRGTVRTRLPEIPPEESAGAPLSAARARSIAHQDRRHPSAQSRSRIASQVPPPARQFCLRGRP